MKPRIAILFTGGTICMSVDPRADGAVPALTGEEIVAQVSGLDSLADLDIINFSRLPGPHMTPRHMLELASRVRALLARSDVQGVVVTHGTDTLEETAYLVDLLVHADKPIVVVGAMRNSSELSWDGPANLYSAVRVAITPEAGPLGVVVVMNDQLIAAAEAIKTHTEAFDTFQSRDLGPVGLVDSDRVLIVRQRPTREHVPADRLDDRVELIKLSAGSTGNLIDHARQSGMTGLVLEALGRGNVPVTALPAIERVLADNIPVVITSRCHRGRVLDTYAYEGAGRQLTRHGAILGGLLPSHKARLKLMALLGAGYNHEQIRRSFEE